MKPVGETRAAAGTPPCLRAFASELGFVYQSLRRHGVQPVDAGDLTQEVFVVMWRRWGEYQPSRPLRAWLAGIVYKVAHRHLTRSRRFLVGQTPEVSDPAAAQDEQLATARARSQLLRALDQLTPVQRAAVVLHYLDELPMREVAAVQGVPLFTAYTRLRSGRHALARTMGAARGHRRDLPALFAAERMASELPAKLRKALLDRARAAAGAPEPSPEAVAAPSLPSRLPLALAGGLAACLALALLVGLRLTAPASKSSGPQASVWPVAAPPSRAPSVAGRPPPRLFPTRPAAAAEETDPGSPRGPLALWSFDEPAGSVSARDRSGNGHHCGIRSREPARGDLGGAWSEGVAGGALSLDGAHWLECPGFDRAGRLNGELTIVLWMRADRGPIDRQILVTRQLGTSGDRVFSLRLHGSGLELLSHVWERTLHRLFTRRGQWTHVAAVRDLGATSLYVNGALAGSNFPTAAPRPLGGAGTPLLIGGLVNGPEIGARAQHLFRGDLDELAIYDRALGPDEIHTLATRPPSTSADPRYALTVHRAP
jgi:RNA polymerase sigma-70 factor (ECF subfamily)